MLVLTSTFPRWDGDSEPRFVLDLCLQLAKTFQVRVLAPSAPGAAAQERFGDVRVERFRYAPRGLERLAYEGGIVPKIRSRPWLWLLVPFFLAAQVLAIVRVLRRGEADAIHAHWLIPQAACAVLARALARRPVPILCTLHGADLFALRGGLLARVQRFIALRCDRLGAVSAAIAERLVELGVPRERIDILPMGVPTGAAVGQRDREHVAFAGRLVEKKGVPVLLHAMARLKQRGIDASLTIAGAGQDFERCRKLAGRLGIKVEFTGAVTHEEVLALFARATLAVMPSIVAADGDTEGLGLVALEAMGTSCPVVASDLPAVKTYLRDGENGFLSRAGDPEALAAVIERVLSDSAARDRVGASGRRFVEENFGWPRAGRGYAAVLEEMLRPER